MDQISFSQHGKLILLFSHSPFYLVAMELNLLSE
ncbi:hypothetical protein COLO4_33509 [Corchorus olitorius]|uniref:Uncharacterized protein n=1 Tax=Corchorus olitorius TaxID=93759 RepID=A0A1R3GT05_9ROSI|nr:hypothetical protein COLO4_33509 [Corchorus olitorius]